MINLVGYDPNATGGKLMLKFLKWLIQPTTSSEDIEQKEIDFVKRKFERFNFIEQYHDLYFQDFLFLDKDSNQIGIYQKIRRIDDEFTKEVVRTIPFSEIIGLAVIEDDKEIFSLGPKQLQFGVEENEISLFINSLDEVVKEGEFSKLYLQILASDHEKFDIVFYDDRHPRADMRKSIRTLKRWFQMIATGMLLEHARRRRKKLEEEKKIFIEIYKTDYKCRSTPFYFIDIFNNLETIFKELQRGPFAEVNYHHLEIEAYRNGTLIFRDVDQMYENTELHHKWLRIVVGRWGITNAKVLRAKEPSERVNLAEEPDLKEKFMKELLYFASFDQMTEKLKHAKVSKMKGKKIYIQCEERYEEELYHWWERVKVNCVWIKDYLRAFLGKEYEIIFESESTEPLFITITQNNFETIWHEVTEGEKLKKGVVRHFENDTYYIYFEDPLYVKEKRYRILYEQNKVEEKLKRLTGKEIQIEIVEQPESVQAERIAHIKSWMEKMKKTSEKMSFAIINDTTYGRIYAMFVDDQLYIYDGTGTNNSPYLQDMMKRDVNFVPDIENKINVYIRDIVLKMSKEEANAFKEYLNDLHNWQLEIIEKIAAELDEHEKVKELFMRFYEKEIKERYCILQLDHILNGEHALEEEIEKFSRSLLKKNYFDEKEHLLKEAIRRNIFTLALQDIANTFQKNSEGYFDDPFKLNKEEMLQYYHKRLFSNVENIEDVAAFTAFLLHHQKIDLNKSFYDTVISVKNKLVSVNKKEEVESEIN